MRHQRLVEESARRNEDIIVFEQLKMWTLCTSALGQDVDQTLTKEYTKEISIRKPITKVNQVNHKYEIRRTIFLRYGDSRAAQGVYENFYV